jgi:hypothetical protein
MDTTDEPFHLRGINFGIWKIMDIPTSFIQIIILFDRPSEYCDGVTLKLLRWMQNLHQLAWDHGTSSYADKYSKDE